LEKVNPLKTQIAILGGGPAGYVAAMRAAQLGAEVVLVEERELGGVCLNRGCIPTKALLKNSEVAYLCHGAKEYGIDALVSDMDWQSAWLRKERVVKNLRLGLEHLITEQKIVLLRGRGEILNPRELTVYMEDGRVKVSFSKLIITVGSDPSLPNIPGIHCLGVITSNEALELQEVPKSLVIVGAGAVGLEFAHIFNNVGSKVTVIEAEDSILPQEDEEITKELLKILKRRGIGFKLASTVKEIHEKHGLLEISMTDKNKEMVINTDKVLMAVGRKLRTATPDIINLGIKTDSKGAILVNERMETSIEGIYAAGDAIGGKLLAHLAYSEGFAAVENALGFGTRVHYDAVPSCVYTQPEVAAVGIHEREARKRGIPVKVGRSDFRHNGRALTLNTREGFVKVVIRADDHVIIGGQILGPEASEMISELTLAITLGVKAEVLARMIHPHPTLSEAIMEACGDAIGMAIHQVK